MNPQMLDPQQLDRVITCRGYAVKKTSIESKELEEIRKELTVAPIVNDKFGKGGDSFPIFSESATRIYMPRAWAMRRFGIPQANIVSEGERLPAHITFGGKPFDYQINIINKFIDAGANGLICVPCGKGKTFMALAIAARLGRRFCIVVDKEFLLNQWKGEIETFFPGLTVGIYQGDKKQTGSEVIYQKEATATELKERCRLEGLKLGGSKDELLKRLAAAGIDMTPKSRTITYDVTICMIQTIVQRDMADDSFKSYGFTIFDECHHLGAAHFSRVLAKIQTRWMLGLSATPTRDDGLTKVFEWYLGEPVYWEKIREADETVAVYTISCAYTDPAYAEEPVDWKGDVVMARMLGKVVDYMPRTERIATLLKTWLAESVERRILILSERKEHLRRFEELLEITKVPIGYYIGGMTDEAREESATKCRVILATYAMASEAMNIKTLNAVALVSPRKKVEQSTGRILRIRPEQRNLEHRILDVIDQHSMYLGQWRKRLTYYKQCGYKLFRLGEDDTVTVMESQGPKKALDLSVCQMSD
jgi:superfamily II DNA or RNA helicase